MKPEEIRTNLNKPVRFTDPKLYVENAEYILTGAIFRLGEQGFYYQAELTDAKHKHSLLICELEKIEVMED